MFRLTRRVARLSDVQLCDSCGNPPRATLTLPETTEAAGPCCGTATDAAAEGACCGSAAKADAVASGQGCCG